MKNTINSQRQADKKREVRKGGRLTRPPRLEGNELRLQSVKKKRRENGVYHKDGSLLASGNMVNGKMEGFWRWFRKNGTKMRTGYFKAGKQTGKWTTYDKNGKVVKITIFK